MGRSFKPKPSVGMLVLVLLGLITSLGCRTNEVSNGGDSTATGEGHSEHEGMVATSSSLPPILKEVSHKVGVDFFHTIGKPSKYHFPDIMVAGCGVLDFDGDGLLDLIVIDSGDFGEVLEKKIGKRRGNLNRLWKQLPPDEQGEIGTFRDVTDSSGLIDRGYGSGLAIGDVNNDGYPDVFFGNYGEDRLFLNQCDGTFQDVTKESGISNPSWSTSATFFDFDRDGKLDLFVTNYVSYLAETNCGDAGAREDYCNPRVFRRTADRLYRNVSDDEQVRFEDVSLAKGISAKEGPGLGVVAADFTGDGWPDLYVANDGAANFLWVNQGGKSFVESAGPMGCAMGLKGEAQAGMGVVAADIDQNGQLDLVVTHLDGETNAAYLGKKTIIKGRPTVYFEESGMKTGVQDISAPMTGFGLGVLDLDNDGDLDMLTANGRVSRREADKSEPFWADYREMNQISLNEGNGTFIEYQTDADDFCQDNRVSRGLVVCDLNNDGQLECVVSNTSDRCKIYRNVFKNAGNWIGFRVIDPEQGGRYAIGAQVKLHLGDQVFSRHVKRDGSYLSSGDPRVHFGLGEQSYVKETELRPSVIVQWPDGQNEQFKMGATGKYHDLKRGAGTSVAMGQTGQKCP